MKLVHISEAVLFAACVLAAPIVFAQSQGPQTQTAPQYDVYSAFLRSQLVSDNDIDALRVGPGKSPISAQLNPATKPISSEKQAEIKRRFRRLQNETLQSFANCLPNFGRLDRKFELPVDYKLLEPAELEKEITNYGYIEFSCVGMNGVGTQALFVVSRLRCACAVSKFILMEKKSDGQWAIREESLIWIA